MKYLIYLITLVFNLISFSQKSDTLILKMETIELLKNHKGVILTPNMDCPYTVEKAKEAIVKGKLRIIVRTDFTGAWETEVEKTNIFLKKYNLGISYVGCVRSWNIEEEDISGFNKEIIDFLCLKYGLKVRIEYNELFSGLAVN